MSYKYSDSNSSVTIVFVVPASTKKTDLDIAFNSASLRVGLKGSAPICEGAVYAPLNPSKCKASIKKDTVTVHLEKATSAKWPSLFAGIDSVASLFFFGARSSSSLQLLCVLSMSERTNTVPTK
jgi:hypothetical protein